MPEELKAVPYNSVPRETFLDIMHQVGDYSVALGRMTGNDTSTFQILGSGTFVRRGDDYGVLTAHHVLHRPNDRPVELGGDGPDRFFFMMKLGRTAHAAQVDLEERPLGWPDGAHGEYGPDLTFVRFRTESLRSRVGAIGSFWPLDKSPEEVLAAFVMDRACIINAGYPGTAYKTTVGAKHVDTNVTLFGGVGGLVQSDIVLRGDWDYINSPCDYRAFPHLPTDFRGMSGGGIWSALLKSESEGILKLHRFALVGVNFWQTGLEVGIQMIRGHFVRSIYRTGWKPTDRGTAVRL